MTDRYPEEVLDEDDDCGTMPDNVEELRSAVVGHRIVSAAKVPAAINDKWYEREEPAFEIVLDDGRKVWLFNSNDCCAYTELESFLLHPERVDHIITGVGTTEEYAVWHIYADLGDILEPTVGWSCGNPFYYGYGFDIRVVDPAPADQENAQ